MEKLLLNKRVLFIGCEYFDYHFKIQNAMIELGAVVEFYPVMNYNLMYSILRRVNHNLFLKYNYNHGEKILKKTKHKEFDYIFVIQGQQLSSDFFTKLRLQFSRARFINYHWDAVRITEFGNSLLDIIPFFDRVFSFDGDDCIKYEKLSYLPLFYTKENDENLGKKYDIAFVGTVASFDRYKYIRKFENNCNELNLSFKYFLYVPIRIYIRYLLKGIRLKNVSFSKISYKKIIELFCSAKAVIDLPNHVQSGLTMRTFEVLAVGTKLITTNMNIKKEPFYNKSNVQVVDLESLLPERDFIVKEAAHLDMSQYHINQWIKILFEE